MLVGHSLTHSPVVVAHLPLERAEGVVGGVDGGHGVVLAVDLQPPPSEVRVEEHHGVQVPVEPVEVVHALVLPGVLRVEHGVRAQTWWWWGRGGDMTHPTMDLAHSKVTALSDDDLPTQPPKVVCKNGSPVGMCTHCMHVCAH